MKYSTKLYNPFLPGFYDSLPSEFASFLKADKMVNAWGEISSEYGVDLVGFNYFSSIKLSDIIISVLIFL